MTRAKSVLLTLCLCLLLTSCFRVENSIKVDEDGSVAIDQVLAVNVREFSPESIGFEGTSIPRGAEDAFCEGVAQGINESQLELPGQQITDYRDGNLCGARISVSLEAAPDHSDAMSAILEQPTRLVSTANGWEFETLIVPAQIAKRADFELSELTEVLEQAELLVHVELPGVAIDGEHNATKTSGGKFTWEVDLLQPESRLFAQTGPATGLDKLPVSPKVLGVVAANLAVVGGLGWFFLRDEKPGAATVSAANAVPAGTGSVMETPAAAAAAAAPGTPYFDEAYGIWMLDDPARGLLWHRDGTDEWVPF